MFNSFLDLGFTINSGNSTFLLVLCGFLAAAAASDNSNCAGSLATILHLPQWSGISSIPTYCGEEIGGLENLKNSIWGKKGEIIVSGKQKCLHPQ